MSQKFKFQQYLRKFLTKSKKVPTISQKFKFLTKSKSLFTEITKSFFTKKNSTDSLPKKELSEQLQKRTMNIQQQ